MFNNSKKILFVVLIFLVQLFFSCTENSSEPEFSIIEKINNGRPYETVLIYQERGNWHFDKNGNYNPFVDAYAEKEYFIVKTELSTHYFNIPEANEIFIYQDWIELSYK